LQRSAQDEIITSRGYHREDHGGKQAAGTERIDPQRPPNGDVNVFVTASKE